MDDRHKKTNAVLALVVFAVTFVTFLTTVAPTVSFWDCGEYIGAAHSLGIPHPPGNPLYVLVGRFFSIMLPFFTQVAYRVNLISVLSGAFTAVFMYLIVVRVMISWMGIPQKTWQRLTIYTAGLVGAFFAVFNYTFWFSAVEASVYIPSMLFISICTWLAIIWSQSTSPDRDRLLVLIAYLVFLSIGIHMMGMIAMAPIGLFIFLKDREKLKDWRLWFIGFMMASVIWQPSMFLAIGPMLLLMTVVYGFLRFKDSRVINPVIFGFLFVWQVMVAYNKFSLDGGFVEAVFPFAALFGFTLLAMFLDENAIALQLKKKWRFMFWLVAFASLGYSVHAYIPIRSALDPIIDENNPVITWEDGKVNADNFRYFLERKQYGSESMISRMFWRRGSWQKQLGIDDHMGYGGFHITQFFHFGDHIGADRTTPLFESYGGAGGFLRLLVYLVPTFFMIYGWAYLYKRNKNLAIFLIVLFVLSSIGLVLYMNFADGYHAEKRDYMAWVRSGRQGTMPTVHREVRIRDYFFTAGFMFFGMWIGLAAGSLLHLLFTNSNRFLRTQMAPIAVVLFLVSPALPYVHNYAENNRTNDWIPYDYAYNLLMSCEKDGIIFTNGDNDTFPLWFLQEAEGIRKDVRIVNLSLLNTTWYIKQLKDLEPKVPISFSHKEIEALTHELNPLEKPLPYTMPKAGIRVVLPGRREKQALRVQDKMVVNIVDSNKWRKPIYFAVTVSNDNMMGLQPYLQMEGLVYRVLTEKVPSDDRIDLDRTLYLIDDVYQFRGLGKGNVIMSETAQKLMSNYAASFIQVALTLEQPLLDKKSRIESLEKALVDTTADAGAGEVSRELTELRAGYQDTLDIVINKLEQVIALMPWDWRPRTLLHRTLTQHDRYELALEKIRQARMVEPDNPDYMKMEAQILDELGRSAEANDLLRNIARSDQDPFNAYALLMRNYQEQGMYDSAVAVMEEFQKVSPGDRRATAMISELRRLQKESGDAETEDTAEPVSSKLSPSPAVKG